MSLVGMGHYIIARTSMNCKMIESFSSLLMVIWVSLTFKCCTPQAFSVFKDDQLGWPVFRIKVDHLFSRY